MFLILKPNIKYVLFNNYDLAVKFISGSLPLLYLHFNCFVFTILLPRDAMHKRGLSRHAVSVSVFVRPSVTFVDCVETNKLTFTIFSTSGSHTFQLLLVKRHVNILTGSPPNVSVECRWGRQKSRF